MGTSYLVDYAGDDGDADVPGGEDGGYCLGAQGLDVGRRDNPVAEAAKAVASRCPFMLQLVTLKIQWVKTEER